MAGQDTSRGINFQYACSIGFLIDFFEHPDWERIQFEGDRDIEDIVVFNSKNEVVVRAQIKQKIDPYQWEPREFRDVITKFSEIDETGVTTFLFIYSGAEGKSVVQQIRPLLIRIQHEGWNSLNQGEKDKLKDLLNEKCTEFISRVQNRFLVNKQETWRSIEAQDLRRLRKLLTKSVGLSVEEGFEESIYKVLFHAIAQKTEGTSKYFRVIERDEIFRLIGFTAPSVQPDVNINEYVSWLRAETVRRLSPVLLDIKSEVTAPEILNSILNIRSESQITGSNQNRSILDVAKDFHKLVLVGESGSGKTFSLWQLVHHQCERLDEESQKGFPEKIPIVIDLSEYDGVSVNELIRRTFLSTGLIVAESACEELASTGKLLLLLDDIDLCRIHLKNELQINIKHWIRTHPSCSIVVTTHTPSDGHRLGLPTYRLLPLDESQARQILMIVPGISPKDAYTITNSLPSESNHLVQFPLTLHMLAYAYLRSDGQIPRSRAPLYKGVLDALLILSEQKGFFEIERSDKVRFLSLLAKWMLDNEISIVSPATLNSLLEEWIDSDTTSGGSKYLSRLRLELMHSGLFLRRLDTDLEFIHPTFRAFLAAFTLSESDIPSLIHRESWRNSLLFWSSLNPIRISDVLVDLLMDNAILLGKIIEERSEKRMEGGDVVNEKDYFIQLHDRFIVFVGRFPALLKDRPWKYLPENKLHLCVGRSEQQGYVLYWEEANRTSDLVQFMNCSEIIKLAKQCDEAVPSPLFLISNDVIRKYHPLELVYLWVIRSLYDILAFTGFRGGIEITNLDEQSDIKPAVALVTNRFLLYHEIASNLPNEILSQLPFYANKAFQLAIEVINYSQPSIVLYTTLPSSDPEKIDIIQSVLNEEKNAPGMFRNLEGVWHLKIGNKEVIVPEIEEVDLGQLMTEIPGTVTQQWLAKDLKNILPLFPPEGW